MGGPKNFALRLLLIAAFLVVWEAVVRVFEILSEEQLSNLK